MKIKNSQIVGEVTSKTLNKLVKEPALPVAASFAIAVNLRNIEPIVKDYNAVRTRLVDKYTKRDEAGNPEPVKDVKGNVVENSILLTDKDNFEKEMQDLLDIETEVNIIQMSVTALGNLTMSIPEASSLLWMITP